MVYLTVRSLWQEGVALVGGWRGTCVCQVPVNDLNAKLCPQLGQESCESMPISTVSTLRNSVLCLGANSSAITLSAAQFTVLIHGRNFPASSNRIITC